LPARPMAVLAPCKASDPAQQWNLSSDGHICARGDSNKCFNNQNCEGTSVIVLMHFTPCTIHHALSNYTPCIFHHALYTMHYATIHHALYTINHTPCTIHLRHALYTINHTLHIHYTPYALNTPHQPTLRRACHPLQVLEKRGLRRRQERGVCAAVHDTWALPQSA
jgi:hypothetical protein